MIPSMGAAILSTFRGYLQRRATRYCLLCSQGPVAWSMQIGIDREPRSVSTPADKNEK